MAGQQRRILKACVVRRRFDSGLPAPYEDFEEECSTDAKEKKTESLRSEHRRQARYEGMIGLPLPQTWSARMPAYCYTVLCPAPIEEVEDDGD